MALTDGEDRLNDRSLEVQGKIKKLALSFLIRFRIYPNILFSLSPFKIVEFEELTRGVDFSIFDRILDIGCGEGLQTFLLGKRCDRVVGVDISEGSISRARQKALQLGSRIKSEFICEKLENAELESESFDKIFSFCVIEHIPNFREVLHEAHRLLKPNGCLIMSADSLGPIGDSSAIEKHRRDHRVERYFRRDNLTAELTEVGFKRVRVYPVLVSDHATKIFVKGIENQFSYGIFSTIANTIRLRHHERLIDDGDEGIFLVAKCTK